MQGEDQSNFGETEARLILNAGWRQGSIFRPPAEFSVPLEFDRDHEMLVVCTQSCTVVSERIETDPNIEFLVAEPVKKYNPRSAEATGKNLRRFHLSISGVPNTEALACDINRRFFVHRKACLRHPPDVNVGILEESVRNFAGWIARYYTRIALPDELTRRARNGLKMHWRRSQQQVKSCSTASIRYTSIGIPISICKVAFTESIFCSYVLMPMQTFGSARFWSFLWARLRVATGKMASNWNMRTR